MKVTMSLAVAVAVSCVIMNTNPLFSQDQVIIPDSTAQNNNASLQEQLPEVRWIWGEVVEVDAANNQLKLKYLDYESDTEKEILLTTDAKTSFENIKSVAEIKPLDNLSVDYTVTAEGNNIAKNISLEKVDSAQDTKGAAGMDSQLPLPSDTAAGTGTAGMQRE